MMFSWFLKVCLIKSKREISSNIDIVNNKGLLWNKFFRNWEEKIGQKEKRWWEICLWGGIFLIGWFKENKIIQKKLKTKILTFSILFLFEENSKNHFSMREDLSLLSRRTTSLLRNNTTSFFLFLLKSQQHFSLKNLNQDFNI